jgi:dsRNA-specific ribonuclease
MEESYEELIKKHKLSEEEKVSEAHMEAISNYYCKHWERLLEINNTEVSDIRKRLELLHTWREQKGSKATYKQLVLALLKIDGAEKVREILKKELSPVHDDQGTCSCKKRPKFRVFYFISGQNLQLMVKKSYPQETQVHEDQGTVKEEENQAL